jgi:hypothetical protein
MPRLKHPKTGEMVTATEAGAKALLERGYAWADPNRTPGVEKPVETAPRAAWDEYARSIGLDPAAFSSKAKLIDAIGKGRSS